MPGYTSNLLLGQSADTIDLDRKVLSRLNLKESELTPIARAKIWKACAADIKFFAFNFCRTKDQGGNSKRRPIRQVEESSYVSTIFDCMDEAQRRKMPFLMPKSRRMMCTWTCCIKLVHMAKFFKYQLGLFQSYKEEVAAGSVFYKKWDVARCSFLEFTLPPWLRSERAEGTFGKLFYPTGSEIRAIAQGKHSHRGETVSALILDECAFWDQFTDSYDAAQSLIEDGTLVVGLTSANAGSPYAALIGEGDEEAELEADFAEEE